MSASSSGKLQKTVHVLRARYGKIDWWPGDRDEVMIGAILTQQTRWENVTRALAELRSRDLCSIVALSSADIRDIEEAVRCTGFFRIKSKRLQALAAHVMDRYGSVEAMERVPTAVLRAGLLLVNGIGEETADSILCYGFSRTSFVIDAYTEKILQCTGIHEPRPAVKTLFERVLPCDNTVYRETHAHIVEYAKEFCIKKRCDTCILVNSNG
jgi:endonuclease III related protein